ncbi:MAG: dienelactone hydrolase family protein [Muribaculaceae bacterium]
MNKLLSLFIIIVLTSSCSNHDYDDDIGLSAVAFNTVGLYHSIPDNSASPVDKLFDDCIPMQFITPQGKTMKYRILTPVQTSETECFPLVIYLHSFGNRGTDNANQMKFPLDYFVYNRNSFPAYYLFPQCPEDAYWSLAERPSTFIPSEMEIAPEKSYIEEALMMLIEELASTQRIDTSRIYILGFSMGGIGTLDLIARHTDTFAASVSFCGTGNPLRFTKDTKTPLRLYHNQDDPTIPVAGSRVIYKRFNDLELEVQYFEKSKGGHTISATNSSDMLDWLFKHHL